MFAEYHTGPMQLGEAHPAWQSRGRSTDKPPWLQAPGCAAGYIPVPGGLGGYGGQARSTALRGLAPTRTREEHEKELLGEESEPLSKINTRTTTDSCCCFVLIAFWIGMVYITYLSLLDGDPRRLYHGFDYHGRLCGVDPNVEDKPLIYWPDPRFYQYPVCMAACPTDETDLVLFPHEDVTQEYDESSGSTFTEIVTYEDHIPTYRSHRIGGRFCMPSFTSGISRNVTEQMIAEQTESPVAELQDSWEDLANAWFVLAGAVPFSVVIGYAYFHLLNSCARYLTWAALVTPILLSMALSVYCVVVSRSEGAAEALIGDYVGNPVLVIEAVGLVAAALTCGLAIVVWCLHSKVQRVVACIEASCEAMEALPWLLTMPIFEICMKLVFAAAWVVPFAWVVSSGEISAPDVEIRGLEVQGLVRSFTYTNQQQINIGYFVFGLIWGLEIMTALCQFVVSYAVVVWYYTPYKDGIKPTYEGPRGIVIMSRGMRFATGYHMGSLALGAFIVSVFRFIRWMLEIISAQAKASGNKVAEMMASACMCCIWCFEEIVRYINKNAIIQMVIKSTDFFHSAGAALELLLSSSAEVVALNGITFVFQCLGAAVITCAGSSAAFWLTDSLEIFVSPDSERFLENRVLVVVVAGLISLLVAGAFMFIFDLVSDTLLFCYLDDMKDGKPEDYAPKQLRDLVADNPSEPEASAS